MPDIGVSSAGLPIRTASLALLMATDAGKQITDPAIERDLLSCSIRQAKRLFELTEDDKTVLACLQTAQKHRQVEPFTLARRVKGWTRDRWDAAHAAYQQKQHERWA